MHTPAKSFRQRGKHAADKCTTPTAVHWSLVVRVQAVSRETGEEGRMAVVARFGLDVFAPIDGSYGDLMIAA